MWLERAGFFAAVACPPALADCGIARRGHVPPAGKVTRACVEDLAGRRVNFDVALMLVESLAG